MRTVPWGGIAKVAPKQCGSATHILIAPRFLADDRETLEVNVVRRALIGAQMSRMRVRTRFRRELTLEPVSAVRTGFRRRWIPESRIKILAGGDEANLRRLQAGEVSVLREPTFSERACNRRK
jgi:hypothetical protein